VTDVHEAEPVPPLTALRAAIGWTADHRVEQCGGGSGRLTGRESVTEGRS
jgi:hypothetical protein